MSCWRKPPMNWSKRRCRKNVTKCNESGADTQRRHARACPGHPRLSLWSQDVDGRDSPAMTRIGRSVVQRILEVAGVSMLADLSGALFWQEQRLLVVSDLHLEKGSSFATRGVLLPPYDTVATLGRLAAVIARHDPRMVIALGDSFHDRTAHERLSAPDREALAAMQARRDWIWISGNHDPALPSDLGGVVAERSRDRPDCIPPRADRGGGRNRRPSASQGAGRHPRPIDGAAMLCLRWRARGDAGVRRLYRRPEHPRCGVRKNFPERPASWRMCSAMTGCTPSRRRGVIEMTRLHLAAVT